MGDDNLDVAPYRLGETVGLPKAEMPVQLIQLKLEPETGVIVSLDQREKLYSNLVTGLHQAPQHIFDLAHSALPTRFGKSDICVMCMHVL